MGELSGPPWHFKRYVNGQEMAEGCIIEREPTFELAARKAASLFGGSPGSVFVLEPPEAALSTQDAGGVVEEIERLLAKHVREINRVVASGYHEGPAIREAAREIAALSSLNEGGDRPSTNGEPDGGGA